MCDDNDVDKRFTKCNKLKTNETFLLYFVFIFIAGEVMVSGFVCVCVCVSSPLLPLSLPLPSLLLVQDVDQGFLLTELCTGDHLGLRSPLH